MTLHVDYNRHIKTKQCFGNFPKIDGRRVNSILKAAIIKKYGKPDVLHMADVVDVYPNKHEVKIHVHASSVNPVDFKTRQGKIFFMSGWSFPKVLGSDFSGVITECGASVSDFKPGDDVYGFTNAVTKGGAYGEFLCTDSSRIALKPSSLTFLEAGTMPLAASTAYQGLYEEGGMISGQRILITGATGGVGHFAVQIAKAANCHVTGICHSLNQALAYQFGCDEVLPYDQMPFTSIEQRYDIIFDAVGKYGYFTCKRHLNKQGTYVTTLPSVSAMLVHMSSFLHRGRKARFFLASSNPVDLSTLGDLVEQGLLKPYIENVFSIQDIAQVHALSETEKVRGKIGVKHENV